MKTIMVRYKVKPEFADENQRLIEQVFAQLARDKHAYTAARPLLLACAPWRAFDGS